MTAAQDYRAKYADLLTVVHSEDTTPQILSLTITTLLATATVEIAAQLMELNAFLKENRSRSDD